MEDLGEVRVGAWEGISFAELEGQAEWVAYNQSRGALQPPEVNS